MSTTEEHRTTTDEHKPAPILQMVLEYLVHVVTGVTMFLLAALPAVGLDLALQRLHGWGVSRAVIVTLQFVKYAILVVDVALLCLFLVKIAIELVRRCLMKRGTPQ